MGSCDGAWLYCILLSGMGFHKKILDSVQLEMDEGVYGLLGPNGAGKSTLIRLICGIEQANTGTITYGGKDISELDEKYRELLGYVPQKTGFYVFRIYGANERII